MALGMIIRTPGGHLAGLSKQGYNGTQTTLEAVWPTPTRNWLARPRATKSGPSSRQTGRLCTRCPWEEAALDHVLRVVLINNISQLAVWEGMLKNVHHTHTLLLSPRVTIDHNHEPIYSNKRCCPHATAALLPLNRGDRRSQTNDRQEGEREKKAKHAPRTVCIAGGR